MPRPRKYIQVNGETIDGVHLHRSSRRYYIIDRRGKQVYFRDWKAARAARLRLEGDPVAVAQHNAEYAMRHAVMHRPELLQKLADLFGSEQGALIQLECSAPQNRCTEPNGPYARDGLSIERFADSCGAARFEVREAWRDEIPEVIVSSLDPKLNDVGVQWLACKRNEVGLGKGEKPTRHMTTTLSMWDLFTKRVGNIRISELQPEHFRRFQGWADRESAQKPTAYRQKRLYGAVKAVMTHAQSRYPEWAWAPGIGDRLRALKSRRHEPAEENAEPMPPEVFRELLARCDAWATADVTEFDTSAQRGRALKLQAQRKRREGRQLRAVLMLACNCGLNIVDVGRLTWTNLKLDHDTPHVDLQRTKALKTAGRAISRRTPLLPQVLAELQIWRRHEPSIDGRVFRTAQGTPISKNQISGAVRKLLDELTLDRRFTYRHLRNVGPTLAANAGLPEEMIERFLGHKASKISNRYKGLKPVEYLQQVVDLIGKHYFECPHGM
jgi:integrase